MVTSKSIHAHLYVLNELLLLRKKVWDVSWSSLKIKIGPSQWTHGALKQPADKGKTIKLLLIIHYMLCGKNFHSLTMNTKYLFVPERQTHRWLLTMIQVSRQLRKPLSHVVPEVGRYQFIHTLW